MNVPEAIDFRKIRDVGDVLNVTFQFLRENVVKMGKSLLFFVAPPMALVSALSTRFQAAIFDVDAALGINFGLLGAVYLLSLLSTVLAITVVFSYVVLYQDYGPDGFEVADVWTMTLKSFFRMLGTLFFLLVLVIVGVFALALFIGLFAALASGLGGGSTVVAVLLVVFLYLAMLAAMAYFGVTLSLIFPMRMRESVGVVEATLRCFRLVKNHWWATFGALFVAFLVYAILSGVFFMPYYVTLFIGLMHDLEGGGGGGDNGLLVALSVVAGIGGALLYSVPLTATAFQYFNLVERKERTGLLERIDAIGDGVDEGQASALPPPAAPSTDATDAPAATP